MMEIPVVYVNELTTTGIIVCLLKPYCSNEIPHPTLINRVTFQHLLCLKGKQWESPFTEGGLRGFIVLGMYFA
jgi:hypothetical protein